MSATKENATQVEKSWHTEEPEHSPHIEPVWGVPPWWAWRYECLASHSHRSGSGLLLRTHQGKSISRGSDTYKWLRACDSWRLRICGVGTNGLRSWGNSTAAPEWFPHPSPSWPCQETCFIPKLPAGCGLASNHEHCGSL